MRRLWRVASLLWQASPWAMWRGAAAALTVLVMGAALLGLSGWFITATGAAGLAGIGIAFDVFRPSAGVRFLALGRASARYAERLLTHDTTLHALAKLRLALLDRLRHWPIDQLRRLRSAAELTRITADVDALDGLVLRLILPLLAGFLTHIAAFAMLWWLTVPSVALSIAGGYLLGGGLVLWLTARAALVPSKTAERSRQTLRRQVIGLFRGQRETIQQGLLPRRRDELNLTERAEQNAESRLNVIDERAGLALNLIVTLTAAAALLIGDIAVGLSTLSPAAAAIGFFAALGLAETLLPLRRGLAELGRMHDAAGRILPPETPKPAALPLPEVSPDHQPALVLDRVTVAAPGRRTPLMAALSLTLRPGETAALTGHSGLGKSTLLDAIAAVSAPLSGRVTLLGTSISDWPDKQLREHLTLVPQRARPVGGSIRENLAIACDDLNDSAAWEALTTVELHGVVQRIGGLDATLGESGAGLSGGEARRLALARAVLRRPSVLLLDEPTEGLEGPLARQVLANLKHSLPDTAILIASHRRAEQEMADYLITLQPTHAEK
ncbi:amino acid ABC transporter ATP-binding/permease protein [Primorskyibacter flagellatus]|uniref:amino acid ABC transporter ATP-binding/permease protein n=1 Tax=Primorskyibacter flagellatus TaxID=1387277 RepID=UPI003A9549DB